MDGKKVYQIQINGVTESIDAVESLNKQLDALDKRINALSNATINIKTNADTTTTTSGNGSKSRASSLSEEEKLLNQINTLEEKRVATEKEVYQGYLAAKDVLKQTESMQKQIAAQERLQANNYANTMDGLKQRLADLKSVHFKTDIDSDEFKRQTKEIKATTDALKKLEEEYGVFGRSVGNYERAAEGFRKIKVQVGETTREYENFRQAVKDLTEERLYLSDTVGTEAKAYKDVDVALRKLKSDYNDLNRSSGFMDKALDTAKSFSALASIGQGLSSLFGVDNAKFQESMQRLMALMLVLQGIEALMVDIKQQESVLGKGLDDVSKMFDSVFGKVEESIMNASKAFKDFATELMGINLRDRLTEEDMDFLEKTLKKDFSLIPNWIQDAFSKGKEIVKGFFSTIHDYAHEGLAKIEKAFTDVFRKMAASNSTLLRGMAFEVTRLSVNMANGLKSIAAATKVAATAVKALGMAFLVFMLPEIINWFSDLIKSFKTAEAEAKRMGEALNTLNAKLKTRMELLRSDYMRGVINDEEFLTKMYKEQASALNQQIELLAKRSKAMQKNFSGWSDIFNLFDATQNTEFTGERFTDPTTVGAGRISAVAFDKNDLEITVHSIEQVENAWHKANQALEQNKDYLSAWGQGLEDWDKSLLVTVSDTEEVMRGLGNIKLSDFIAQFQEASNAAAKGKISAEEYADELYKLKNEMNDNEVLASVIANLDKYIPDEKVREQINNIINDIVRLDDAFNQSSEQQIHYWHTVCIEGMKKGWERTKAQLEEEERYEIVQHGRTEEQIQMIRDKYRRKREEAQEAELKTRHSKSVEWAKKLRDAEDEYQRLLIELMKNGWEKQKKQLELERDIKLKKIKEDGVMVEKLTEATNAVYQKKIQEAWVAWSRRIEGVFSTMWQNIYKINHQAQQTEFEASLRDLENNFETLKEKAKEMFNGNEIQYEGMVQRGNGNTNVSNDVRYTEILRDQFKARLADKEAYYDEVERLDEERLTKQYTINQEKAQENYNNEIRTLTNSYYQEDEALKEHLYQGEITEEQYNEAVTRLAEERASNEAAIFDKHAANMKEMEIKHQQEIKEIKANSYKEQFNEYDEYLNKLSEVDASTPIMGWTGIINYSQTKKRNEDLVKSYLDAFNRIEAYINKLNAHKQEFDPIEFDELIKNARNAQEEIRATIGGINNATKQSAQEMAQQIVSLADQGITQIQNIMSSMSEIVANGYEADIAAQERFIEKYEENLQKQKDATQQYADAVSEIEGNLKEARGDARQYLLDNLNAQVAAQRASLAQEKKIEKEKEKAEERKKKLEHDQAVAKKKADVAQALINASMAVSYAAVNKWPFPALAMMALASAAGLAQVAAIQSQQIPSYGEGGQLSGGIAVGNRHRDGGIKVLGGRAEIEGGEYVTNRISTSYNSEVLEFINSKERKLKLSDFVDFYSKGKLGANIRSASPTRVFADGGTVPTLRSDIDLESRLINVVEQYANRQPVVAVKDILDVNDELNAVKVLAGVAPSSI